MAQTLPTSVDLPSGLPPGGTVHVLGLLSDILQVLTSEPDESPGGCPLPCFCRVAVYPSAPVPSDSCEAAGDCADGCEGQLWGAIQLIQRVQQPASAGTGACEAYTFTAQVGAVRCAAIPHEDGTPPDIDAVQRDAARQAVDADGIRYAIACCPARPRRLIDAGIVLESWTPLGPQGGCVGGFWTIRGRFDDCC
jgi:hypothetical protein